MGCVTVKMAGRMKHVVLNQTAVPMVRLTQHQIFVTVLVVILESYARCIQDANMGCSQTVHVYAMMDGESIAMVFVPLNLTAARTVHLTSVVLNVSAIQDIPEQIVK